MRSVICTATAAFVALFVISELHAQRGPVNGMRPADLRAHAITNATVIPSPGETIENATIVIRDGVIVAVGADVHVPAGAWVWPGDGLRVYPGLIEPALLIDPGDRNASAGGHWNPRIMPEIRMSERSAPEASLREEMRKLGFTTAAVYPSRGILRGTGNVIALAENDEHVLAYRDEAFMAAALEHGGRWDGAVYPGSLMGAIALFRQTMYDAQWHAECRRMYAENPEGLEPPIRADALVALGDVIAKRQIVLFDVNDEQNALRAARLAEEFDLETALLGSGLEFRRLNEIANLGMHIIVPVQYPERPRVSTLAMADRVSLRDMMTWEQAPTNARRLINEGVEISLTTHRLNRRSEFFNAVRGAIEHGLSEDQALAALTTKPAQLLGIDDITGTIAPGRAANLVVVKGGLFEKDAKIRDVWVNGRRHEVSKEPDITFIGKGVLRTDIPDADEFAIEFDSVGRSVSLTVDEEKKINARNVTVVRDQMSFILDADPILTGGTPVPSPGSGFVRFSGAITGGAMTGSGVLPNGSTFTFTIEPTELRPPEDVKEDDADEDADADAEQPDRDVPAEHDDPITGVWDLTVRTVGQEQPLETTVTISRRRDGTLRGTSRALDTEVPLAEIRFDENTGVLRYVIDPPGGPIEVVCVIEGETLRGTFTAPRARGEMDGVRRPPAPVVADAPIELPPPPEELVFPLGEFGFAQPPAQQDVLILGATIWTSAPGGDGIIENGDLHIADGKIAYVGPSRTWSWPQDEGPMVIEANGRHVTPGLIDCHSHTGITGGVNEWTNVNTAEVRIGDVINPDDINWYRQLAGGLTAANQLHGSANPIGGQNSIVKLKWGAAEGAEAMRVPDARPGIKFALGENVVRRETRYPNTRMGVETVMRDAFTAAKEYAQKRRSGGTRMYPVRRDLELDALVDILNDERDIHCHSYRQDEILALMRVAEDLGFRVATFQHILEGYKVAEVMAQHGAHGSAFSDWWAYKVEVMDAIPHAGALMHNVGVNVSFNSDSSELARRMNTEAAKAVRYGGVAPHEALKFVTLNPAIQMGIDHRTGSLEAGKDADFVVWSGDPLSTYTRAEQTWIEGAMYFCIEKDRELREVVQRERQRLIHRILLDEQREGPRARRGEGDGETPRDRRRRPRLMEIAIEQHVRAMENMIRMGINPDEIRPGECGCNEWWYGLR